MCHAAVRNMHARNSRGISRAPSSQCCSCRWVFRLEMPEAARIELVDRLAVVEANLSTGTSERLQLGALVAAFDDARRIMVTAA